MSSDVMHYDQMVENALRSVVKDSLKLAADKGLPGNHHFYISFRTASIGVDIPGFLKAKYPEEMTVVLQHQFWDLIVEDEGFSVTLSFNKNPEKLYIPFNAITTFADPTVQFGLQFRLIAPSAEEALPLPAPADHEKPADEAKDDAAEKAKGGDNVVTLDTFRKK